MIIHVDNARRIFDGFAVIGNFGPKSPANNKPEIGDMVIAQIERHDGIFYHVFDYIGFGRLLHRRAQAWRPAELEITHNPRADWPHKEVEQKMPINTYNAA